MVTINRLEEKYRIRRQRVFLLLSGIFLGSLAMLNLVGISRWLDLSFSIMEFKIPLQVAVGILPYPITFLCTDLISELYGRKRAADMVWVGFIVNIWIIFILWLGGVLPGANPDEFDQLGNVVRDAAGREPVFFEIRTMTFAIMTASMVAYLTAQFCDVHLFHFWKRLTKGKHLWLRNNGSTLVSQLIDTTAVILVTYFLARAALPIDADHSLVPQLIVLIASGYVFKLVVALIDTGPAYLLVSVLRPYLGLKQYEEVDPGDFSNVTDVGAEIRNQEIP
ncbi:MAG: queuosine precursor transporter [Gammaproteobacteria bacterium]|nr:queuosine precursor transporter [Gammaproteobacteria bacterium]MDE0252393.1 queuosine precursor transporter [Gammaproteobacteria bacterium]MDE0402498.1 queuosine precursor transporter [Gammaproteobacteria bacterium]